MGSLLDDGQEEIRKKRERERAKEKKESSPLRALLVSTMRNNVVYVVQT